MLSPDVIAKASAFLSDQDWADGNALFAFKSAYQHDMKEHNRIVLLVCGPAETPMAGWDISGNPIAPDVLGRKRERAAADWQRRMS